MGVPRTYHTHVRPKNLALWRHRECDEYDKYF